MSDTSIEDTSVADGADLARRADCVVIATLPLISLTTSTFTAEQRRDIAWLGRYLYMQGRIDALQDFRKVSP